MRLIDLVNGMTVYLYGNDIEKWEKICKDAKEGKIPTITLRGMEYALVRHGHWIMLHKTHNVDEDNDYDWRCSECNHVDCHNINVEVPFCWYCGAKMDLEEVNDE